MALLGPGPRRVVFLGSFGSNVPLTLSLSLSPNVDRIIRACCYCLLGEIVGEVTSRDVQSVCPCFIRISDGGAASTRLHWISESQAWTSDAWLPFFYMIDTITTLLRLLLGFPIREA